jgi:peptide deformylase
MSDLRIRKFPEPILRKHAGKVSKVGPSERKLLQDMAETMYLNSGVGLAANQVGVDAQIAVIDIGDGLIKLINPSIVKREGQETVEEGCLSVPGTHVKVRRSAKVVVNFLDEEGNAAQLKAEGLLARAIQHEADHLSGRLIIDHLNPIKRLFLKKK